MSAGTGNAVRFPEKDPPKRHTTLVVAFVNSTATLRRVKVLLKEQWEPDAVAVGSKAAYLWCSNGIIQSKLAKAFSRVTGEAATIRNWATVLKLQQTVATGQ